MRTTAPIRAVDGSDLFSTKHEALISVAVAQNKKSIYIVER